MNEPLEVDVEWDGQTQSSYKAFIIKNNEDKILKRFSTGDPVIDWLDFLVYMGDKNMLNSFSIGLSFDIFASEAKDRWVKRYVCGLQFVSPVKSYQYQVLINSEINSLQELIAYYNKHTRKKKIIEIFDL